MNLRNTWFEIARRVAFRLPDAVIYWCFIKVHAYATQGEWGMETPSETLCFTASERWRKVKMGSSH